MGEGNSAVPHGTGEFEPGKSGKSLGQTGDHGDSAWEGTQLIAFAVDRGKLRRMSLKAVLGTAKGWVGIVAAILIATGGILAKVAIDSRTSQIARAIHARDDATVQALGIAALCILVAVAIIICLKTWQACNTVIGVRLKQTIQVGESKTMLYMFEPYGFFDPLVRVAVWIDLNGATVAHDPKLDVLTVHGDVRTQLCRNINLGIPQPGVPIHPLDSYRIPNCFEPDLYASLLAITGQGGYPPPPRI